MDSIDTIDTIDGEVSAADEAEAWPDEPDGVIPLERLEADLCAHAAVIAAAACRWLGWLADYEAGVGGVGV